MSVTALLNDLTLTNGLWTVDPVRMYHATIIIISGVFMWNVLVTLALAERLRNMITSTNDEHDHEHERVL